MFTSYQKKQERNAKYKALAQKAQNKEVSARDKEEVEKTFLNLTKNKTIDLKTLTSDSKAITTKSNKAESHGEIHCFMKSFKAMVIEDSKTAFANCKIAGALLTQLVNKFKDLIVNDLSTNGESSHHFYVEESLSCVEFKHKKSKISIKQLDNAQVVFAKFVLVDQDIALQTYFPNMEMEKQLIGEYGSVSAALGHADLIY
jgi:hypothetical protein